MNNDELKNALFGGLPVVYKGIEYQRVSGILYRVMEGKLWVRAELTDKCGHSIVIADPAKVELKDEVRNSI